MPAPTNADAAGGIHPIADNRKARHDYYHVFDTYQAGVVLLGTAVKAIRGGRVNLKDSYGKVEECNLGLDGTGVPVRPSEVEGRRGKQPDGSARTREVKLVTAWMAETRDKDGKPVRDPGSVSGDVVGRVGALHGVGGGPARRTLPTVDAGPGRRFLGATSRQRRLTVQLIHLLRRISRAADIVARPSSRPG